MFNLGLTKIRINGYTLCCMDYSLANELLINLPKQRPNHTCTYLNGHSLTKIDLTRSNFVALKCVSSDIHDILIIQSRIGTCTSWRLSPHRIMLDGPRRWYLRFNKLNIFDPNPKYINPYIYESLNSSPSFSHFWTGLINL